jgi:hypothetical protein
MFRQLEEALLQVLNDLHLAVLKETPYWISYIEKTQELHQDHFGWY